MSLTISNAVSRLEASATVSLMDKGLKMKAEGIDVIDLSLGEPDFPTPMVLCDVASRSMASGFTHYVSSKGIAELREAVAEKLDREDGIKVNPGSQVIITPGTKTGLYYIFLAILDPGDEVIYIEPGWVSYRSMVQLAGGMPVPAKTSAKDGFKVSRELLERCASPRTKAILINSPCNPSGHVMSRAEMDAVAAFARERDLFVISDEIYQKIIYDGNGHISIATLPGMRDRTLTVNGMSKAYAMTGWRVGYIAGNKDVVAAINKVVQQTLTCVASFVQVAAAEALQAKNLSYVTDMARQFTVRRDFFVPGLNALPGVKCAMPEGTFYAFADFSALGLTSSQMADYLLEKALVIAVPGSSFGDPGEGHLRFSFAASNEELEKALDRMRKSLSELRAK